MTTTLNLVQWDKIKYEIEQAKDFETLKKMDNTLAMYETWAKQEKASLEVQNKIAEYRLRTKRKIGEFSKKLPQAEGNQYAKSHDVTKQKRLSEINLSKQDAHRYEAIASLSEKEFEKHIQEVKDSK